MKALKYVVIVCVISLISACTSDDSTIDTNAQEQDLIGTWNLTEESQDGKGTATIEGIPVSGNISSFAKDLDAQITFSNAPNSITASGGYTEVVTVSFLTITNTEEIPVFLNGEISQGTWSMNSGVITLSGGNDSQEINIVELTATTLKVEINVLRDVVVDGIDVAVDTTVKMTFVKQ
jgi:hypothetical protein